jgi:hypothetical protein
MSELSPTLTRGLAPRKLWRQGKKRIDAILSSEHPANEVRSLVPQEFYYLLTAFGKDYNIELVELASIDQIKFILDLDCWHHDEVSEEKLIEWLALTDAAEDLNVLRKIITCIDIRIFGYLICKYVEVIVLEESSEQPPQEYFTSPDKGFTWLRVHHENSESYFQITRALALIFDTNPAIFYQLLAIPSVSTASTLLEEAYQDRVKRLAAEGIPEIEFAFQVCEPSNLYQPKNKDFVLPTYVAKLAPSLFLDQKQSIFEAIYSSIEDVSIFESEFALILNAATVRWHVSFSEIEKIKFLASQVRGAIEIGFERVSEEYPSRNAIEHYQEIGLQGAFKQGLFSLNLIRFNANKVLKQKENLHEKIKNLVLALAQPFPYLLETNSDTFDQKPIEFLDEVKKAEKFLAEIL